MKSNFVHGLVAAFGLSAVALTGSASKQSTHDPTKKGEMVVIGRATVEPARRNVTLSRIAENMRSIAKLPAIRGTPAAQLHGQEIMNMNVEYSGAEPLLLMRADLPGARYLCSRPGLSTVSGNR